MRLKMERGVRGENHDEDPGSTEAGRDVLIVPFNGDEDEIPFTVMTKVGRDTLVFEDSWDINRRGSVRKNDLYKMMFITIMDWEGQVSDETVR